MTTLPPTTIDNAIVVHCCLPRRLRTCVEATRETACDACQKTLEKGQSLGAGFAYFCTADASRSTVHWYRLNYCKPICILNWWHGMARNGYSQIIAPIDSYSPASRDELWHRIQPVYTDRRCGNCAAVHMEPTPKFQQCSGCDAIHYCSKECQAEHWPRHKPRCASAKKDKAIWLIYGGKWKLGQEMAMIWTGNEFQRLPTGRSNGVPIGTFFIGAIDGTLRIMSNQAELNQIMEYARSERDKHPVKK